MKLVYIAAPLSAPTPEGIAANLAEAKRWVALVARVGLCPVASWIPLAEGLLDGGTDESAARALGLACDMAVIERCDALLVCGEHISEGMKAEIEKARRQSITVLYLKYRNPFDALELRAALGIEVPA